MQIQPLVCQAFNADFNGDQMAVHLPLSAEAQAEARILMLSAHNLLSPAHGRPLVTPTQDMVIGAYYLTQGVGEVNPDDPTKVRRHKDDEWRTIRTYRHAEAVQRAYEAGDISLHEPIILRIPELEATPANGQAATYVPTTTGRVLFNEVLPEGFEYVNDVVRKGDMGAIVDVLADAHPKELSSR